MQDTICSYTLHTLNPVEPSLIQLRFMLKTVAAIRKPLAVYNQ